VLANELKNIGEMPRAFLDSLGVGIVLIDARDGCVVYANREFCRLTGYSSRELVDDAILFSDLTHPDDRESSVREHSRLLNGQTDQYRIDKRYVTKEGAIVWAHVTASVTRNTLGAARWMTRVIEDITERKLLEQKLAVAEHISGLATWNWYVKSDSSQTSSRYNALFGLAEGTPQPSIKQFLERVHPDDRKSVSSAIQRAIIGGSYAQEYRTVRANGEIRWMRSMATSVVNSDNEVTNLVGATVDITDSKIRPEPGPTTRSFGDIVQHIRLNWNKPISIPEIARLHGVSPRSIHKHFASIGTTPMNFVKLVRLEHARQRLTHPDPNTSVTGVALACGFNNLGHFARDYRQAYGERPSATLRSGL